MPDDGGRTGTDDGPDDPDDVSRPPPPRPDARARLDPAPDDGHARSGDSAPSSRPASLAPNPATPPLRPRSISPRRPHSRSPDRPLPSSAQISRPFSRPPDARPLPPSPSSLMDKLVPLLRCPLCDPPRLLTVPTTLRCGHSVCARHVQLDASESSPSPNITSSLLLPSCPLPTCTQSRQSATSATTMQPDIPRTSNVIYRPSNTRETTPHPFRMAVKVPQATPDVLLSKTVDLVRRSLRGSNHADLAPRFSDDEEHDDSDQDSQPSGSRRASKRRRRTSPVQPTRRPGPEDAQHFEKELLQELTCEICYMLLYKPITSPCQHTFCSKCLQRSMDHNQKCPLCRQDLPGFHYFQDHPVNKVVLSILLEAFPESYQERGEQLLAEERDARLDTPIFVCQLTFPGMPTLLHFFEPRYRLMLRRCLEQTVPRFGMIMPPRPGGTTEYGTMLEIRSVQMLPDGRSMVETSGSHRFRILERGTFDGYMVGRIEGVHDLDDDVEPEAARILTAPDSAGPQMSQLTGRQVSLTSTRQPQSSAPRPSSGPSGPSNVAGTSSTTRPRGSHSEPSNAELVAICHAFVDQLRSGMAPWVVQRLNNTYGPMPSDIGNFTFWMGLVLPIDEHEKAKLLPIRSPRLRLRLLVHWIEQLNSQWWFMNGCTIC
ncbi:LON-domain-containing protein [Sistotremastrum niveocremeum HHB9708]|uniref:LON-domain-containing protein n=1 Tax=Sistotremastrum niveocremeum HHB9708 TaxID=1314777 RepID=A0A164Z5U6_9AGAM|nr:LON-domain-containing protein [Sistotremastrum niveocremeum HHB9708]